MRGPPAGPRVLLRRLREIMAEPISAQERLDRIVRQIAANMVAEVCSVYVLRADGVLELYATEGLNREAVHRASLRVGQGLVGTIAAEARPLNLPDAQSIPAFPYLPETGEEIYNSFLGVPILRAGAHARRARRPEQGAPHLLRRGGRGAADDGDGDRRDDRRRRARRPGAVRHLARRQAADHASRRFALYEGVGLGHVVLHEPRVVVTELLAEDAEQETGGSTRRSAACACPSTTCCRAATSASRASIATCSRPIACSPTTAAGCAACTRRSATASRPRPRSRRCRATRAPACCARPTRICASGCTISTISPTGCSASS